MNTQSTNLSGKLSHRLQTHSILHTYCCIIEANCTFVHSGATYLTPRAVFISIYIQNIHLCHVISVLSNREPRDQQGCNTWNASGFKKKKLQRLTQCNHVAIQVDIADYFPTTTKTGRHFGELYPSSEMNQSAGLLRSSENRLLSSR